MPSLIINWDTGTQGVKYELHHTRDPSIFTDNVVLEFYWLFYYTLTGSEELNKN